MDYRAAPDLWEAVIGTYGAGYICLNCFASAADEKLIDWPLGIEEWRPISMVAQMRVQAERKRSDQREASPE